MIHSLNVSIEGPLEPYARGFAAELSGQGYTPASTIHQLRLLAHLSRWMTGEGLDSESLSPAEADRFLDSRRNAGYRNYLSPKALGPLLKYLRQLGVTPPPPPRVPIGPVEVMLVSFGCYLAVERGLAPGTIEGYSHAVRPFLSGRVSADGLSIGPLTPGDVAAFVVARSREQAPGSAKLTVTALRSLLGFLHVKGMVDASLAAAVPSVPSRRLAGLPKGLRPDEVRDLLASCDRRTAIGRRDFAIITVLVRLGLRAGELVGLRFGDIDWRAGEILVRGKGRRSERLPLPSDVGEALADYLCRDRPAGVGGRTVFLRVRAPHCALSVGGLSQVVATAGRRAGLGKIFAHRLRHTAATQMLRAGASLTEIGQVLRHRRALSTAIYAKVDSEALRPLARHWPGVEE